MVAASSSAGGRGCEKASEMALVTISRRSLPVLGDLVLETSMVSNLTFHLLPTRLTSICKAAETVVIAWWRTRCGMFLGRVTPHPYLSILVLMATVSGGSVPR